MQWGNSDSVLERDVKSVVLLPLDGESVPCHYTNKLFTSDESRESWFEDNKGILDDECEIIICISNNKMHSTNFDGTYRFIYSIDIDGFDSIKLATPVELNLLMDQKFREFLSAVYEFFLRD